MDYQELYKEKLGTLDGALALVKSGDTIAISIFGSEPSSFLSRLHEVAERVTDVTYWSMLQMDHYQFMSDQSLKGKIDIITYFYDDDCRKYHNTGRYSYVPMNLHSSGIATIEMRRPTVFVCSVSPMDENGNCTISFDLETSLEWMDNADTVIFEVNKRQPRVYGETSISIDKADYIYEVDRPLPVIGEIPITDTDRAIAENVASLVKDGDCIQLGLGGLPNAIGESLMDKKDLGIHTEMITSSMGRMMRAGVVNNSRKNFNPGKTIGAFAFGDNELYELMTENPHVEIRRAAYVNDPFVIAQNDNLVSINTAIQTDLTGQICSESIGFRQFSGTGGAMDFAFGAYHSKGGRGIVAFASTAAKGTVSKIQPVRSPGSAVSIPRNLADYVVTEYGIAKLRGRSIRQRVDALISIAHPDFREELRREADKMMLW